MDKRKRKKALGKLLHWLEKQVAGNLAITQSGDEVSNHGIQ